MTTIRLKPDFKKNSYEKAAWEANQLVCGIDEVGRGCLAGPVVTAAVMLTSTKIPRFIKDSKVMTAEEREEAYKWIITHSLFATSVVHHRIIDTINIYHATMTAMKRASMQLFASASQLPACILIDAMPLKIPLFNGPIYAFPFGESKSVSIAAASIVAKVTRDRLMQRMGIVFPGYGMEKHKGYATPLHREKIELLECSIIHRRTFTDHFSKPTENQLTLFESYDYDESAAL